jgi:uncharacterized protein
MQPQIKRLVELQGLDIRLGELRARLDALPQQLAEIEQHVARARGGLTSAKEALAESLKNRRKYEMDVDTWRDKARKYKDQSFAVKTNEAYKALQHEIQHAEMEVANAEDRLLERMVAGEEFERQVKAAEAEVKTVERGTESERQKILSEQAVLQKELEAKTAERGQELSGIPENLLDTYERIARRRHGVGIAEVRDEACSLCGMRVLPHVVQELRRVDIEEIFQCETCTRILYYVERPAPVAAPSSGEPGEANAPASEG